MIEVPVQRSTVRGAPAGTYLAPLSGPQAEVQVATQRPMPVRIPDTRPGAPPGAMIDTFAPTGRVSTSPEGTYTPPLTEPEVSLQKMHQAHQQWLDTTTRALDSKDGLEKDVTNRDRLADPNRFLAAKSPAQVQADKNRADVTTTEREPLKIDVRVVRQEMLDQLDTLLSLQRNKDGVGGLTLGVDPAVALPGVDLGKVAARAAEIAQVTGDVTGAVRMAIVENVGTSPKKTGTAGGTWYSSTGSHGVYAPGGTVQPGASGAGPVVQRDESGAVTRPPRVTTRTQTETRSEKPYEPPKIAPIEPPVPTPAPTSAAVPQIDIAPEQKLQISRSMENTTPQDAKASAARMIKQKPQLRAAIIALLRQHNIDTSGL
jgi:hypothetical protein